MDLQKDVPYVMPFVKDGIKEIYYSGMPTLHWNLLRQGIKALDLVKFGKQIKKQEIVILDARSRSIEYEQQGFTLVRLDSEVTDYSDEAQKKIYVEELKKLVQDLHPHAKKIDITDFLYRGVSQSNKPATDGPHLDFYQDLDEVSQYGNKLDTSGGEREGLKLEAVIGIWKPIHMTSPVYDYPLCLLDASTFKKEDQVRFLLNMDVEIKGVIRAIKGLAAHLNFSHEHKWYYYPEMTTNEVVLFHQHTADKFFANIHCAFRHPELPDNYDARSSVETRALVYV